MPKSKEQLQKEVSRFLETASDQSLEVLETFINGATQYDLKQAKTYINGVLDYQEEQIDQEHYEARIKLSPFVLNTVNISHGGILTTFADTAMGTHVHYQLPEGFSSVTSEITVHFLKPATGKELLARSEVIKRGRSLWVLDCKVYNDQNLLVCSSTASFFVFKLQEE